MRTSNAWIGARLALLVPVAASMLALSGCAEDYCTLLPAPPETPQSPLPPLRNWPFETRSAHAAPQSAFQPIVSDVDPATGLTRPLDANGDGHSDVIVVNAADLAIDVLLNDGAGALRPLPTHASVTPQTGLGDGVNAAPIVADFDGDGDPDLLLMQWWFLGLMRNQGDGTFAAPVMSEYGELGLRVQNTLAVGDFDGDGDLDLALACNYPSDVRVLLNDGRGAFALQPVQYALTDANELFGNLVAADYDGDGRVDLAAIVRHADATAPRPGALRILRNAGDAAFSLLGEVELNTGPRSAVARDFDGDADVDLAIVSDYAGTAAAKGETIPLLPLKTVALLLNDGNGAFRDDERNYLTPIAEALAAGDVDGDGDADLIASAQTESSAQPPLNTVTALFNDGQGLFDAVNEMPARGTDLRAAASASAVDLDADKRAELVVFLPRRETGQIEIMRWNPNAPDPRTEPEPAWAPSDPYASLRQSLGCLTPQP